MDIKYKSNNNIVYSCKYHVIWCPKYRRKVLVSDVEQKLKELIVLIRLARIICEEYATICIEDLNIKAMQKLWGKKISDLSFSQFVNILKYQASKLGSTVVEIPRFYPSSKTCFFCDYVLDELPLKIREWTCPNCGFDHDRDRNAAINILRVGTSTLRRDTVRPA